MTYGDGFWATVELLVALGGKNESTGELFVEDVEDWLEAVSNRMKLHRERMRKDPRTTRQRKPEDSIDYGNLIDCSFYYPPVRTRLEMLMGSNVVRLTDRKYMLKLMARIRQEYENQQQIRIEERKKKELMRTKKMILDRLIPIQEAPLELRKYPLFQLYLYCDAIVDARRKKRAPKKAKVTESMYRLLYPDEKADEEEEEDEDEEIYMKTVYVNGATRLVPMSSEDIVQMKRTQEGEKDIEDGYMLTHEDYDHLHYETDAIKELKEAQTVEEMYAKAHEVVGILYSHVDEGRYQKAAREKMTKDDEKGAESSIAPSGPSTVSADVTKEKKTVK